MNNLEIIKKEINFIVSIIQAREISIKLNKQLLEQAEQEEYSCEEEKQLLINIAKEEIKELEESIVLLQQIKTDLETYGKLKLENELKETPKKVVVDELCWDDKACPNCKKSFLRKGEIDGANYCPHCGQKLDWKTD